MSSLAASRADNFYFPPDWRPEYGGISKFQGSKGANQYQQYGIIRFELPFDGWCTKCERHISKGTRFNAKKEQDGNYFSTKIWSFHMKCASCDEPIVVKTNPEKKTYDFVQGIRKMEQDFIPDFDDSIITATTDEERFQLANNAIYKLQHDVEDTIKTVTVNERLAAITDIKDDHFQQDYESNSHLRHLLRTQKKKDKKKVIAGQKYGLKLPLMDRQEEDKYTAQLVMKNRNKSKKKYQLPSPSESIFSPKYLKNQPTASSSSSDKTHKSHRSTTAVAKVPLDITSSASTSATITNMKNPSSHKRSRNATSQVKDGTISSNNTKIKNSARKRLKTAVSSSLSSSFVSPAVSKTSSSTTLSTIRLNQQSDKKLHTETVHPSVNTNTNTTATTNSTSVFSLLNGYHSGSDLD